MEKRRYRIHFVATFDHEIEAGSSEEAQQMAEELQTMPAIAITSANDTRCRWNLIAPVGVLEELTGGRLNWDHE